MGLKRATDRPDEGTTDTAARELSIAALAARQHGLVATRQLKALGFGDRQIARRVASGRLHRIHRGVYAVGHAVLTPSAARLAAVLACGDRALASHTTAAAIWGLRPHRARTQHITTPGGARSRTNIRVHRPRDLAPQDHAMHQRIPVCSLARTLVDLGDVVSPDQLRAAFVRAEQLRLLDMRAIDELLERASERRGPRLLRELLRGYDPRWQETRSGLEIRFLDALAEVSLPKPEVNAWIEGRWLADFLWRGERLVVETDSARFHGTPVQRRRDALRDRAVREAGYAVIRVSDEELSAAPRRVIARVRAALDGNRSTRG